MKPTILDWQPMDTAPNRGPTDPELLLKTHSGIVSAWYDPNDMEWICFDDMFTLEFDDATIEGWCEIPKENQ